MAEETERDPEDKKAKAEDVLLEIVGICHLCIHQWEPEVGEPSKCDAFPEGIPKEILVGEFIHTKPYPGDHGIQFEAIPDPSLSPPQEWTE